MNAPRFVDNLSHDLRYSLRSLRLNPAFTAIAVLSLALGIGANTAIFTILNALVLKELPVSQPGQLVEISGLYRNGANVPFSYPMFREIEQHERVFSRICGWSFGWATNVEVNGALSLAQVNSVTGDYYSELGTTPLLGRLIRPDDIRGTAGNPVAVVSYGFWNDRLGRDPAVIGKRLRIDGNLFIIIGVTRRWFTGLTTGAPPAITLPVGANKTTDLESRSLLWLFVTGRLRPGISIAQAHAQFESFWRDSLLATTPTETPGRRRDSYLSMGLKMESAATGVNASLRSEFLKPLYLLLGIGGLILLVVCVTVANLMFARAAARSHEIGTRIALGASPWQVSRQLLIESAVLSVFATLLALALSSWTSRFLTAFMTEGNLTPITLDLRPDLRVFLFAAAIAILTTVLTGLFPAWQSFRSGLRSVLRRNERTTSGSPGRLGKALIVLQVALSLVLVYGAALFLRTLDTLRSFDPGFRKSGVLEVRLFPRPAGLENLDPIEYPKQTMQAVANLPGVFSAAFSDLQVPGDGGWKDTASLVEPGLEPVRNVLATLVLVSPGFFQTLGIPLLAGRDFNWTDDTHHPPVAIVDSSLAKKLAASGQLTGKRVRFGVQPDLQELTVVAVARSARIADLHDAAVPVLYIPWTQLTKFGGTRIVYVRTNQPGELATAVAKTIQSFGHEYAVSAKTIDEVTGQSLLRERATAMLSSFYAAVALALAAFGLFGLMSHTVTRRTREIGIRLALGSQKSRIIGLILSETLIMTGAGILLGLPCALAASQVAKHMLFGISAHDPLILTVASITMLAVGAAAAFLPARRATRVNPIVALRQE